MSFAKCVKGFSYFIYQTLVHWYVKKILPPFHKDKFPCIDSDMGTLALGTGWAFIYCQLVSVQVTGNYITLYVCALWKVSALLTGSIPVLGFTSQRDAYVSVMIGSPSIHGVPKYSYNTYFVLYVIIVVCLHPVLWSRFIVNWSGVTFFSDPINLSCHIWPFWVEPKQSTNVDLFQGKKSNWFSLKSLLYIKMVPRIISKLQLRILSYESYLIFIQIHQTKNAMFPLIEKLTIS